MDHTVAYVGMIYLFVCCIVGGMVARAKGDFFSRGFSISMMAGAYGPIFFWLAPTSHARQGDETDAHNWHVNGVFPVFAHVGSLIIIYVVYKLVS